MHRTFGTLLATCLATGLLAMASSAAAQPSDPYANPTVFESTSSGLLTFAPEQKALRVAVVLAAEDAAVVGTVVRFIDAQGRVIKRRRGDVRNDQPLVVDLTRLDLGERTDSLVRVEVVHALPGVRAQRYPLLVTVQSVPVNGSGSFVLDWNGGDCGCPTCGPPTHHGQHVNCEPPIPVDMTF